MYGVSEFSAIINPPQAAILAIGAMQPTPAVVDGQVAIAQVMRCTLSADHRAIDGALAGQWMVAFRRLIEAPLSLLV
jgi:pyruvate dehydrogenase E2 component (dihydrolipoyllysine-residue acetyltransferase)